MKTLPHVDLILRACICVCNLLTIILLLHKQVPTYTFYEEGCTGRDCLLVYSKAQTAHKNAMGTPVGSADAVLVTWDKCVR
jgi:hypothetical protein